MKLKYDTGQIWKAGARLLPTHRKNAANVPEGLILFRGSAGAYGAVRYRPTRTFGRTPNCAASKCLFLKD